MRSDEGRTIYCVSLCSFFCGGLPLCVLVAVRSCGGSLSSVWRTRLKLFNSAVRVARVAEPSKDDAVIISISPRPIGECSSILKRGLEFCFALV